MFAQLNVVDVAGVGVCVCARGACIYTALKLNRSYSCRINRKQ